MLLAQFQSIINLSLTFNTIAAKNVGGIRDTKTPIFYTQTDGWIERQADSSNPQKTLVLLYGVNIKHVYPPPTYSPPKFQDSNSHASENKTRQCFCNNLLNTLPQYLLKQIHSKPFLKSALRNMDGSSTQMFTSLPNNKILDVTKLNAFADDKVNVAQMLVSVFDRIENIVGKGENAGYKHFSFSHYVFKGFFFGVVKSRDCVVKS